VYHYNFFLPRYHQKHHCVNAAGVVQSIRCCLSIPLPAVASSPHHHCSSRSPIGSPPIINHSTVFPPLLAELIPVFAITINHHQHSLHKRTLVRNHHSITVCWHWRCYRIIRLCHHRKPSSGIPSGIMNHHLLIRPLHHTISWHPTINSVNHQYKTTETLIINAYHQRIINTINNTSTKIVIIVWVNVNE